MKTKNDRSSVLFYRVYPCTFTSIYVIYYLNFPRKVDTRSDISIALCCADKQIYAPSRVGHRAETQKRVQLKLTYIF